MGRMGEIGVGNGVDSEAGRWGRIGKIEGMKWGRW